MDERPPASTGRPPALTTSVWFGVVGAVLLVIGFATRNIPLLLAAGAAGTLSLTSALVWRSQLIDAWRAERKRGQPNGAS
ncbi:MAG TPA: hypothetical protein VM390_09715 [Acidimicrobiales bacterium]|nr:hypothetical protein [Acidimicrobiales bacterium]